jgi:integrase
MAKRGNSNAKLADSLIRRLTPPAKGNHIIYDSEVAGFGIRVTTAGARSFILNYYTTAGRERRYTIGGWPAWTATGARREAYRLRRLIDEDGDPLADIAAERAAPTMAKLCDRFVAEHLPHKRPSTQREYTSILKKHVRPFFGKHAKVAGVAYADVNKLHRRITDAGSSYRANRALAVVSKMFSLAERWQMREPNSNPCHSVERNHESKRKRYLSGDELGRLVTALAAHPDREAADIVRLLLLTGARKGEVLGARWADINLGKGLWSKPAASTKQGEDHEVPLSAPAMQLLSEISARQGGKHKPLGEFVFPSATSRTGHRVDIERDWRQLLRAAGITGLRIHDLRHSFASELASGGSSLLLIGALLGHASVNTTQRYAHLYPDAQRVAVERVGAVIEAAGGKQASAVVSTLKRRPRHGR